MSITSPIPSAIPSRIPSSIPSVPLPLYTLFNNGETGFIFSFDDTTRLFTTSTGETSVASNDDPVGLALENSQWNGQTLSQVLAGQSELVTNGTFDTDLTGWTDLSQGTGSAAWEGGAVRCIGTDSTTNRGGVYQEITTTVGEWYSVSVSCVINSGFGALLVGNSVGAGALLATQLSGGTARYYFRATATTTFLSLRNAATGGDVSIDNATLKLIPDNHATQANTGERGLYQSAADTIRLDGSDDHLVTTYLPSTTMTIAFAGTPTAVSDIMIGSQPASNGRIYLATDANGYLAAGVGTQGTATIVDSTSTDIRNRYTVGVLTADGTTVRLYRDGIATPVYEAAQSGAINTTIALYLGALNNNGSDANNAAGDFKHWLALNRAATPSEVRNIIVPNLEA